MCAVQISDETAGDPAEWPEITSTPWKKARKAHKITKADAKHCADKLTEVSQSAFAKLGRTQDDEDITETVSLREKQKRDDGPEQDKKMQDKNTEAVSFRKKQKKRPCECECGADGASRTSDVTVPESAGGRKSDHRESSESGVCLTARLSTAARKHEQLAKRRARTRHRKICFSEGIIPDVQVAVADPPTRGEIATVGKTIAGRFRNKARQGTTGGSKITKETTEDD